MLLLLCDSASVSVLEANSARSGSSVYTKGSVFGGGSTGTRDMGSRSEPITPALQLPYDPHNYYIAYITHAVLVTDLCARPPLLYHAYVTNTAAATDSCV